MSTSRRVALALLILLDVAAVVLWVRARPPATIPVADAASHRDAATFALADGAVRADLGARDGDFAVAPVVPTRWTPDAPVPMWAVIAPGSGSFVGSVTRAVAVAPSDVARYRPLIAEAERTHGIHGEVGAPVVVLESEAAPSPVDTAWLWNVLLGLNVVLAAFAVVDRRKKP